MTIYSVYMHCNKVNSKVYVGMTSRDPEERYMTNGNGYRNNACFFRDIRLYGWDSFIHTVLRTFSDKNEAANCERRLIDILKSDNEYHGYNIASGGDLGNAMIGGEALARKKRKPVCQYDLNGNYIAEYPGVNIAAYVVARKKRSSSIVDVCNGKRGTSHGFVWRYKGDDFNKYDVNALKQAREVLQFTPDKQLIQRFNSIADAERATSVKHSDIIRVCKGQRRTAGGYIWKYSEVV